MVTMEPTIAAFDDVSRTMCLCIIASPLGGSLSLFGLDEQESNYKSCSDGYVINILREFLFTRSALKAVYIHKVLVPLSVSKLQDKNDSQVNLLALYWQNIKKRRVRGAINGCRPLQPNQSRRHCSDV